MKKALLMIGSCLFVALGFALPWLAAAQQNQAFTAETLSFDAPQISENTGADLFSRLSLVSSAGNVFSLDSPTLRHSAEEAETRVREALDVLANQGWAIFTPARWSFESVEAFLFTSSSETAVCEKQGKNGTVSVTSSDAAAMLWDCRLTSPKGEKLAFLLDDDLGLILSFAYTVGEYDASPYTLILPEENALTAAAFCRDYYQTDFLTPTLASDGNWQIPLVDEAGELCFVTLYATKTELFFNGIP